MNKNIILTLIGIAVILLLYGIPSYNDWFQKKIVTISNLSEQSEHLSIIERCESRFGYSYVIYHDVSQKLANEKKTATILLPPDGFLQAMKIADLRAVEPAVFYYFTGLNSVTAKSPKAEAANWAFVAQSGGRIGLQRLTNKYEVDSMIRLYKRYQK